MIARMVRPPFRRLDVVLWVLKLFAPNTTAPRVVACCSDLVDLWKSSLSLTNTARRANKPLRRRCVMTAGYDPVLRPLVYESNWPSIRSNGPMTGSPGVGFPVDLSIVIAGRRKAYLNFMRMTNRRPYHPTLNYWHSRELCRDTTYFPQKS
jgi:hypothetical protein